MADFHQIRLYQSTWSEAQRLMGRWGTWGHYDGQCSAENCRYVVTLTDLPEPKERWRDWLVDHHAFEVYRFMGGRGARTVASFTVHDGKIWRETLGIAVSSERIGRWYGHDDFPLTLMIDTKSRQRLRNSENDWWIMGDDEQLAAHPFYKEGRPDGCKIDCELAVVTYSTHTPPKEIERLSAFNLSCVTRFKPCTELEQMLPAAGEWHLYRDEEHISRTIEQAEQRPCAIPLWALARDSRYVLAVKVKSTQVRKEPGTRLNRTSDRYESADFKAEDAMVQVEGVLKGNPPWPVSSIVSAQPYGGSMDDEGPHQRGAEHFRPGGRYIIFPTGDDRRDEKLRRASKISLQQCGVWEDTLEARRALQEGFAQNDNLEELMHQASLR